MSATMPSTVNATTGTPETLPEDESDEERVDWQPGETTTIYSISVDPSGKVTGSVGDEQTEDTEDADKRDRADG